MVVDQLVFCKTHTDKPIELFCQVCQMPICMKCKVTKHDAHKTQTIEEALEEMMPQIEQSFADMENDIENVAKSVDVLDNQMKETNQAFNKCVLQIEETATSRIADIKAEEKRLKLELENRREEEIRKLQQKKEYLESKKKEGENVKQVVRGSLDRARHATLLTHLVHGGLRDKLQDVSQKKGEKLKVTVAQPAVSSREAEWMALGKQGLLGCITFKNVNVNLQSGSTCTISGNVRRLWDVDFENFFQQQFSKVCDIKLPDQCMRLSVIKEQVWAPCYNGNIIVYNKDGNFSKTIDINCPKSVTEAHNGDVIVACWDNGLHLITDGDKTEKICDGNFSDVCSFRDKVYALEYNQQAVNEMWLDEEEVNLQMKWKTLRVIKFNNKTWNSSECDTFLIDTAENKSEHEFYFYIMSWSNNTLYMYNGEGQYLNTFTNMSSPWLCGIDNRHNLLISDQWNKLYKVFSTKEQKWLKDVNTHLQQEECYVYDIIHDSDRSVWQVGGNPVSFFLRKYKPQ